jgi:hypothetical protein
VDLPYLTKSEQKEFEQRKEASARRAVGDPRYRPPGEPVSGEATVTFTSIASFCAAYEPIGYAIEPVVRSGSLYSVTAKTGSGKTGLLIATGLAVATGRDELIGKAITKGRVAYVAAENPDDLRMRIMVAAFIWNIDLAELADNFIVLDRRASPEALVAELTKLAKERGFALVLVDTLAAFFDGADLNDNVQAGNFMRRLRPITRLNGLPSLLVAAHPVKNASDDNLIPYGGGAILNEVDGNLTLRRVAGGVSELHWQGKLRGVEFEPVLFRFELLGSPDVLDVKGRQVQLPVLRPSTEADAEGSEKVGIDQNFALLKAMRENPGATINELATPTRIHRSSVERKLKDLARPAKGSLVKNLAGKWSITQAGLKAIEGER